MSIFDLFDKISTKETMGQAEFLIVGLGNPGLQYENTRHNIGFMAIDTLAKKNNIDVKKVKFKSLYGEGNIEGKKCVLLKPSTYMNNSGEAVVEAMNFYKIQMENVIIIYDDISLEPSKLRIRRKGTAGGHNGIKSIIYLTGRDDFPRIKVGVGNKPHPNYSLADWVLSNFKPEEIPLIKNVCEDVCLCIEFFVKDAINEAMNKFNS